VTHQVEQAADRLCAEIAWYGHTLVTFSGGVDSSVVLAAAVRALGAAETAAVTAVSPSLPVAELEHARGFCAELGVVHHTVRTQELELAEYRENSPRRCYFCKSTLLDAATRLAAAHRFAAVATGTNSSDVAGGFRPGIRAARERGARTPLADLGFDKATVREIARWWRLSTWDKPAAACLSSRIAYGVPVTSHRLARVERAELAARRMLGSDGVRDVRVRDLGDAVRLEVDAALVDSARVDTSLHDAIRSAGFDGVPIVVEEFRSGAMNELLPDPARWRDA